MILIDATARKKEEFVKAAAIPDVPTWDEEDPEADELAPVSTPVPQRAPAPTIRVTRGAPIPLEQPRKRRPPSTSTPHFIAS